MNYNMFVEVFNKFLAYKDELNKYLDKCPEDVKEFLMESTPFLLTEEALLATLELSLGIDLYEELSWFSYEWVEGDTITMHDGKVYTINTTNDFLEYIKNEYFAAS